MSARDKLDNQDPFALDYEYNYLPNPGSDVDIYVVDTGLWLIISPPSVTKPSHLPSQVSTSSMYANVVWVVSRALTFCSLTLRVVLGGGVCSAQDAKLGFLLLFYVCLLTTGK